mmetsp:Transcript_18203/g.48963  ORF Transcript_18203/g.48963 Transcript_18203/m.48963 type:complete len:319 (-) Transcript_18203:301-1257(-)
MRQVSILVSHEARVPRRCLRPVRKPVICLVRILQHGPRTRARGSPASLLCLEVRQGGSTGPRALLLVIVHAGDELDECEGHDRVQDGVAQVGPVAQGEGTHPKAEAGRPRRRGEEARAGHPGAACVGEAQLRQVQRQGQRGHHRHRDEEEETAQHRPRREVPLVHRHDRTRWHAGRLRGLGGHGRQVYVEATHGAARGQDHGPCGRGGGGEEVAIKCYVWLERVGVGCSGAVRTRGDRSHGAHVELRVVEGRLAAAPGNCRGDDEVRECGCPGYGAQLTKPLCKCKAKNAPRCCAEVDLRERPRARRKSARERAHGHG